MTNALVALKTGKICAISVLFKALDQITNTPCYCSNNGQNINPKQLTSQQSAATGDHKELIPWLGSACCIRVPIGCGGPDPDGQVLASGLDAGAEIIKLFVSAAL